MARQRSSRATPREFWYSFKLGVVALCMLYASIIVASIDIRRAAAEASQSGLPVLLFGADVGNRPPEDAVEARGGLVAPRLLLPTTRAAPTRSAPSRCEKESSPIRRSVLPRGAGGSLQARRQDIVDGSSRLHSTRSAWCGHHKQRASSIGETEINV